MPFENIGRDEMRIEGASPIKGTANLQTSGQPPTRVIEGMFRCRRKDYPGIADKLRSPVTVVQGGQEIQVPLYVQSEDDNAGDLILHLSNQLPTPARFSGS